MRTRKHVDNSPIKEQFIKEKGCDRHMLDSLLGEYRRRVYSPNHKAESRSTVKKLKSLHGRLNTIASEIDQLQTKPLKFLCGLTLTRSLVGPVYGFPFDTTLFRSEAGKLKEAAKSLSRSTTRKKDFRAEVIATLYVLCRYVPGVDAKPRAITYWDVADLLNEYENRNGLSDPDKPVTQETVRRAVKRDLARRKLEEQRRCQQSPKIAS